MQARNKSRNPGGFFPNKSVTNPKFGNRSVLLPSVATTTNKKARAAYVDIKSPYERSALTPPNRSRPVYTNKPRPSSNKAGSSSVSNLVKKKQSNQNKLRDAVGLLQKPFDYNASFTKGKKGYINSRKSNLLDKRFSLFSNTFIGNKKKGLMDNDTYKLIVGSIKNDLSTYGNTTVDVNNLRKEANQKQKPAAPEIKRKVVNPLNNINASFSDSNMFQYSNVSSVKSFNRPKSMERLKRKPTNKKKTTKSKPKKKTKRKNKKDESDFLDHSGSLNISQASGNINKSFGKTKGVRDKSSDTITPFYRRAKLDQEIKRL